MEETSVDRIFPSTSSTSSSSSSTSNNLPPSSSLPPFSSFSSNPPLPLSSSVPSSSFHNGIEEEEEEEEEEEGRRNRRRKKRRSAEQTETRRQRKPRAGESWCPVCGLTLRPGELDAHLTHELDKLARLPHARPPSQRATPPTPHASPSSNGDMRGGRVKGAVRGSDWEKYERIRNSRERRVGRKRGGGGEITCPVCGKSEGSAAPDEDIHLHIDECLRRVEEEGEDDVEVEVEEYEWCGETRVRATQMLRAEGQLHALGTRVEQGSEDEVVEVCEDEEEAQYGIPQFTDADLPTRTDSPQTHTDTQTLPSTSKDTLHPHTSFPQTHSSTDTLQTHTDTRPSTSIDPALTDTVQTGDQGAEHEQPRTDSEVENSKCQDRVTGKLDEMPGRSNSETSCGDGAVVEALRARVRELESACVRPHHSTCRVCHDDYEIPLVSVSCWHVHCQACWLSSLASRRLCPQCSVITAPGDLRRIYL